MVDLDSVTVKEKDLGSGELVIEAEVTSIEEDLATPGEKSISEELNQKEQKLVFLEHEIDGMQDRITALENESRSLRKRVTLLGDQVVALEDKIAHKTAPTLHSIVLDEIHRVIFASQAAVLGYMNAYILAPVQKLKF